MTTLPEIWCANDERPAVVFVPTSRGGAEPETRALCGDCWWKAQAAARIARPAPITESEMRLLDGNR